MRKTIASFVAAIAAASALAQSTAPTPYRIPVRHADPWAVKAMLEGIAVTSPETSAFIGFRGIGAAANNAAGRLIKEGILVVNPTDNSLWLFPAKGKS